MMCCGRMKLRRAAARTAAVADGFYREYTFLAVAGRWLLPGRIWQERQ
jgi:hypothetical protein